MQKNCQNEKNCQKNCHFPKNCQKSRPRFSGGTDGNLSFDPPPAPVYFVERTIFKCLLTIDQTFSDGGVKPLVFYPSRYKVFLFLLCVRKRTKASIMFLQCEYE